MPNHVAYHPLLDLNTIYTCSVEEDGRIIFTPTGKIHTGVKWRNTKRRGEPRERRSR